MEIVRFNTIKAGDIIEIGDKKYFPIFKKQEDSQYRRKLMSLDLGKTWRTVETIHKSSIPSYL